MNAQYGIEDLNQIANTLQSFSEPEHVDNVDYRFCRETFTAIATFQCEHFGECVVSRGLNEGETEISVDDLKLMASIANAELERIVSDCAWGAVFNVEQATAPKPVPEGFRMEFRPTLN